MRLSMLLVATTAALIHGLPSFDAENTLALQVRTDVSTACATVCRVCTNGADVWDCCSCGNCCKTQ
ncbi:hypothetical protein B0T18DRAFT_420781 [Schizothecium vesticola]|uniref:Uncharacterized protein n=1 Tax=Schizothecium vesticola TaxID=314040 RepID=A0AA40BP98_9PEZI|nr:hypothetical protein B0T18DRAFT_420781 [Schizothecium vesticola]